MNRDRAQRDRRCIGADRARRAHSTRQGRRGALAVELALVFPVLSVLIWAVIEFGIMAFQWNTITEAARVGTRLLIVRSGTSNQIVNSTALEDSVRRRMASPGLEVAVEYLPVTGTGSGANLVGERVRVTVHQDYAALVGLIPPIRITSSSTATIVY